jgi:hypothetical protein
LLLLTSLTTFCQDQSKFRIILEMGSSITTLNEKQPTRTTDLYIPPTTDKPGYTVQVGEDYEPSSNFGTVLGSAGWQLNPNIFMGFGLGYKTYYGSADTDAPIFANLQLSLDKKLSPILSIKGGYNISENFFGDIALGVKRKLNEKTGILFNLALTNYRLDYSISTLPSWPSDGGMQIPGKTEYFTIKNYFYC